MNVLVTGGTGVLGRCVADKLATAGHQVRVLSRKPLRVPSASSVQMCVGDLRDLASLRPALSDVDAVVHCASDVRSAEEVDVLGTANLVAAMSGLDVGHLVYVSIVGVDRIPIRYYRAKRDAESIIQSQEVPWTIQRATQFHTFAAEMLAKSASRGLIVCPQGLRYQPVAVEEVADRLVQQVTGGAVGMAADLGGPEILTLHDLASAWLSAAKLWRPLLPVPFPGAVGRAFKDGANLCPDHPAGGLTWAEYLDGSPGSTPLLLPVHEEPVAHPRLG